MPFLPTNQQRQKTEGIYRREPTTKTDKLRRIGKQSGESVESVLKKRRKATVGMICRKRKVLSQK